MKEFKYELITFFIVLVVSAVVIEWKKDQIRQARTQEVESVLSLLIKNGAPVHTLILEPQDFLVEKMITLEKCSGTFLCANISQSEKGYVKPGQKILSAKDESPIGSITKVASNRNFNSGLFQVKVRPDKSQNIDKMSSKIVIRKIDDIISVPNSSVILEEEHFFVWKVSEDGRSATKVNVKIGNKNSAMTEITEGLAAGDQIVFRGAGQVSKYDKINIIDTKKSSEMNLTSI